MPFVDLSAIMDKCGPLVVREAPRPAGYPPPSVYVEARVGRGEANYRREPRPAHLQNKASVLILNATTVNRKEHPDRILFSPLVRVEGGGMSEQVEVQWQACKRYSHIDEKQQRKWFLDNWGKGAKAPRRSGVVKAFKKKYGFYPPELAWVCPLSGVKYRAKAEARRFVYARLYWEKIVQKQERQRRIRAYQNALEMGYDVIVVDLDLNKERGVDGETVYFTQEFSESRMEKALADMGFSWGHGWLVAAAVAGVDVSKWWG